MRHDPRQNVRLVGFFKKLDFLRAQVKIDCVYRAIDVIFFCGPYDRRRHFCQQLGQRNFGHGDLMPFGKFGDAGNNDPVLFCRAVVFAPGIIIFHRSPRVAF